MEEQNIQRNTNLNLHCLIKEQPKFWQTCFDKPFEENETIKELYEALNKGSDNVEMSSEDEKVFLREIFTVKSSLDSIERIKQNENEKLADFNNRKNTAVNNILLTKIVPLIEKTFPTDEQFKVEDRQNLITKLTSYPHRNYLPLLNLYLQFLVRNKFFENNETKINFFSAFHNEIEACEGGMINRLYQYVGSNNIAQIIEKDLNSVIERFVDPRDQVHILGFIQKYLFGQKSDDPIAINVVRYLPAQFLERLCIEALNGDFTKKLFRREIVNYLKTILTVSDEELKEKFGAGNEWKIFNYISGENTYGTNLKNLLVSFVNNISNVSNDKGEKVNERDYQLFEIPDSAMSIFANSGIINSRDERRKLVEQKGNLQQASHQIIQQALKESIEKLKENVSQLDYAKNTIVTPEESRKKLDILGELYSIFLGKLTYLMEKQFIEKLTSIRDLFDEKVEGKKINFSLKKNSGIPEEIKNYINYNLDELLIDKDFKLNSKKGETSFLKNVILQLQNNEKVLNSNLTNNNPLVLTGKTEEASQLYALLFNSTSNYKSIQDLKDKLTLIISEISHIASLRKFLSTEQFLGLLKNDTLIIAPTINAEASAAVINLYGNLLIKELPDQFEKLLNKVSENKQMLLNILKGSVGQFLTKDYPDYFFEIVSKEAESFIYEVLNNSNTGLKFADFHPGKFIELLNLINNDSLISGIICNDTGKILAEKHPEHFIKSLNFITDKSYIFSIISGDIGEILAEKHPERFTTVLYDKFKPTNFYNILQSKSGVALAASSPKTVFDILNNINDSRNVSPILEKVGIALFKNDQEKFIKIFESIKKFKKIDDWKIDSCISKMLSSEIGISLLENNDSLFQCSMDKITPNIYLQRVLESDTGLFLSEEKFREFSERIKNSMSAPSLSLEIKLGKIWAERFPEYFVEAALSCKDKNESLKILTLESGRILAERYPQHFVEILNNVLDSNKEDNKNVKIKPKPLKDVITSKAFEALVKNAKEKEIADKVEIILERIVSEEFKVTKKFVNGINFIKYNLNVEKNPRTTTKTSKEKVQLLNNKRDRDDENKNGGREYS